MSYLINDAEDPSVSHKIGSSSITGSSSFKTVVFASDKSTDAKSFEEKVKLAQDLSKLGRDNQEPDISFISNKGSTNAKAKNSYDKLEEDIDQMLKGEIKNEHPTLSHDQQ